MNAVIVAGDEAGGIAAAIRLEHEAASAAAGAAVAHAMEAGRLLAEARKGIPHGGWESFVRDRCGIAPRTARLYLQLDARRDRIANWQRDAGLTLREAARLVAEPRVTKPQAKPEPAVKAEPQARGGDVADEAEGTVDAEVGMNPKLAQVLATLAEAEIPLSIMRTIAAEEPDMGIECGQSITDWIAQHDEKVATLRRKVQRWWMVPAWYRPDSLIVAQHGPTGAWVEVWPHPRSPRRAHVICHERRGDDWRHFDLPLEGIRRDELQHFLEEVATEGLPWMNRGEWAFTYEPMSPERTAHYRPYLAPQKRRRRKSGAPA